MGKQYTGDCYEASTRAILYLAGRATKFFAEDYFSDIQLLAIKNLSDRAKLVHGIVINSRDGLPMGHAWIEDGDNVFDLANSHAVVLPKNFYYDIGKIDKSKTVSYTPEEAKKKTLATGRWDAWDLKVPR